MPPHDPVDQPEQTLTMVPLEQSPRGVAERVLHDLSSFPPAPKYLLEEDHKDHQPPKEVRWSFQKPMCQERFFRYLQPSLSSGHVTNGGPLQSVLEAKLLDFVGLTNSSRRETVLACNGTAAMHALVVAFSLQKNRKLQWVTQAFAFPSSCQGPLHEVRIVDIDDKLKGPSLQVLEATKDTFDGVILTNIFGLQVGGILKYEEWCQKNGKLLVVDNAATPLGAVKDGRNLHQIGDGSMVSLHETKVIGRGEGGAVFVDPDLAPFVRKAINFGYNTKNSVRIYHAACNNGKMSDIAAAGVCDHLDYMAENNWKERFQQQTRLAIQCMDQLQLELAIPIQFPTMLSCLFVDLKTSCAEAALRRLQTYGIEAKRYYRPLISRNQAPEAWRWYDQTICLPFHLGLDEDELRFQLKTVADVVSSHLHNPVPVGFNEHSDADDNEDQVRLQWRTNATDMASRERLRDPVPTEINQCSDSKKLTQKAGKVFVVGSGGLGRSIQAWFPDQVSAFIDDHSTEETVNGLPVLGGIQWLTQQANANCDQDSIAVVMGIGSIPATEKIVSTLQKSSNRFVFPTLVHSTVLVAPTADIQEGVVLMPQSMVAPNCSIGRFTLLNTGAGVSHDVKVGGFCRIHGGARVLGWCSIGSRVMLGANSVVREGIKLADSTSLGCGSALVKDVTKTGSVLGGVPAKSIRQVACNSGSSTLGAVPAKPIRQAPCKHNGSSALVHPLHGEVIEETLSKATVDMLREATKLDSDGPQGYYTGASYDICAFQKSQELRSYFSKHIPGYRPVSDMKLTQEGSDAGFAWHTDFYSNFYLEDPTDMVCLWIPLVDVTEETGGRLLHTTSAESHILSRVETFRRLYHEHVATGVLHPWGGKVIPLLDRSKKVRSVKAGQALVFSNHSWHRAEPLKKDGFSRPVYIVRLIRCGARFSRRRANIMIRDGSPGPIPRLLKTEPDRFIDDEAEFSNHWDFAPAHRKERYEDWMSHYSFQESSVARLLIDATDSLKRLSSSNQRIALPQCLEASYVPQTPKCLVAFGDSLRNSVSSGSRLEDFHDFITQLSTVSVLSRTWTDDEALDQTLAGTFAKDAESRQRAGQLYEFLRKRPEWSLQLRLIHLNGATGFFYPPGWTVETLEHYLDHTELLDPEMVQAWKEQTECILTRLATFAE